MPAIPQWDCSRTGRALWAKGHGRRTFVGFRDLEQLSLSHGARGHYRGRPLALPTMCTAKNRAGTQQPPASDTQDGPAGHTMLSTTTHALHAGQAGSAGERSPGTTLKRASVARPPQHRAGTPTERLHRSQTLGAAAAAEGQGRVGGRLLDELVQLVGGQNRRAHVVDAYQALQEGQQARQLSVALVVVPGLDRDAVRQLVPERLPRRSGVTATSPHTSPRAHHVGRLWALRADGNPGRYGAKCLQALQTRMRPQGCCSRCKSCSAGTALTQGGATRAPSLCARCTHAGQQHRRAMGLIRRQAGGRAPGGSCRR